MARASNSVPTLTDSSAGLAASVDLSAGLNSSMVSAAGLNNAEYFVNKGPADASDPISIIPSAHVASASAVSAATTIGVPGDNKIDFVYDPSTGDLKFSIDNQTLTTTGGQASFVSSLTIQSISGQLKGDQASAAFKGGTGVTTTANLLASALTNAPGFTEGFDIGNVLATGLTPAQLTGDLTVKYQVLNGGSLKAGDIVVPEPTSLALLGLGAASLLARRRTKPS